MNFHQTVRSALVGGMGGFLTRPCCVVRTVMSLAGLSSAGLSIIVAHRRAFLIASVLLLGFSVYTNVRRDGWWINNVVTVIASLVAFALGARWVI